MLRRLLICLFFILACLALAGAWLLHETPVAPQNQACAPSSDIGGSFALTNEDGAPTTDQSFHDKYMLVFFGFTHCPDICPTTLGTITSALDKLDDDAGMVAPLFISLDPARDTPAVLKTYLQPFPAVTGLTGSADRIDAVAKAYKVYYEKVASTDDPGAYTIDHSARLYLMDPDGKFLKTIDNNASPDEIAKQIETCME